MAIFIPGMTCVLSGRTIGSVSEAVMFPPFLMNEADPLFVFSDAVIHATVFAKHPLAAEALARCERVMSLSGPANRRCAICGEMILEPDDYLGIGFLTNDPAHPVYRFNCAHFHRSHLRTWPELRVMKDELQKLSESGSWKGDALRRLIQELEEI